MGFKCGILGLSNVGKSTLFNALTATAAAQASNYPFSTIEPNVGEVMVPDPRLDSARKLVARRGGTLVNVADVKRRNGRQQAQHSKGLLLLRLALD